MYRHVDILNSGGFEAYILHDQDDFRLTWFNNSTRIIGPTTFKSLYREGDVYVLPEDIGPAILKFPHPKVIFNQNVYYGYMAFGDAPLETYPYNEPGLLGVITVSAHSMASLTYTFPGIRAFRIVYGIDTDRYQFTSFEKKSPMISTILKGESTIDTQMLFHILNARAKNAGGCLKQFEWCFIKEKTENEVIDILNRSTMFVFLSTREGFPLLPLEAMASGCILATFDVEPLSEFVPAECRFRPGDFVHLSQWIEAVAASRAQDYGSIEELASRGRAIAMQYGLERERESVLNTWRELLS